MSEEITFRDLPLKKKLDHIWTYYRFHVLGGIFGLILAVSLIMTLTDKKTSVLDVIMVDSNANAHSETAAFDEFLEYCGITPFDGAVTLNTNISFYSEEEMALLSEQEKSDAVLSNYDKEQMLFTLMAGGGAEVFFGKGDIFLSYADQGILVDLTTVLSPALLERYADQLVYVEEGGSRYPCAVALKDNPWLAEHGFYTECYFGILYLNDNPESAAQFAEFLLNQ